MFPLLRQFVALFLLCWAFNVARSDTLRIVSIPPGATVEINGIKEGTTPFAKRFPGGYFHRTKTVLGKRLDHPMVARLTLPGYATKEIPLTEGPAEWLGVNGRKHGDYWLVRGSHFEAKLDRLEATFTGNINARLPAGGAALVPQLSLTELAGLVKPAVVQLRGLDKMGTGFFITETGLLATNAHLARGEDVLQVVRPNGQVLQGSVVFVDEQLDIALVKVDGDYFEHLSLAASSVVRQGETVFAVGNPADAMEFSLTTGVVSAIGKFPSAGPGTWIQTDAPINPGNSGGPLINLAGEVVGISTQKLVKKNVNGIGFALSASDLLEVLQRFYPGKTPLPPPDAVESGDKLASPGSPVMETGKLTVTGTLGAHVYVDQIVVGDVPATVVLKPGMHKIHIYKKGFVDDLRFIEVPAGGDVSIRADLQVFNGSNH